MRKREDNLKWSGNLDIFKVSLFLGVFLITAYLVVPIIMSLMYSVVRNDSPSGENCETIVGMYNEHTGHIGDTIGGTIGPLIGALGVLLTFWAFWAQYQANQQQKRDLQIERFESRLFSMLETHRNNVTEIKVTNPYVYIDEGKNVQANQVFEGRAAIHMLFKDLRQTFFEVDKLVQEKSTNGSQIASKELTFQTAYVIFVFGAYQRTRRFNSQLWQDSNVLLTNACEWIEQRQSEIRAKRYDFVGVTKQKNAAFAEETLATDAQLDQEPEFLFGRGCSRYIYHYHRHIFQIVHYIRGQDFLGEAAKQEYVALVRSNLSIHEQLLIYYHSLSVFGEQWRKDDLMKNYCILENMPLPMAEFHVIPENSYLQEVPFDWKYLVNQLEKY